MENIQNLVVHYKIVRCKVESVWFSYNTLKFVKAAWDIMWPYGTMTAKHIASICKRHSFCFHYQLTIETCWTILWCIHLIFYKTLTSRIPLFYYILNINVVSQSRNHDCKTHCFCKRQFLAWLPVNYCLRHAGPHCVAFIWYIIKHLLYEYLCSITFWT